MRARRRRRSTRRAVRIRGDRRSVPRPLLGAHRVGRQALFYATIGLSQPVLENPDDERPDELVQEPGEIT